MKAKSAQPICPRDLEMFEDYQSGRTTGELVVKYGVSKQRVCQIVKRVATVEGSELRPPKNGQRRRKTIPLTDLEAYSRGDLYVGEVCEKHKVSRQTVYRLRREASLPCPPNWRLGKSKYDRDLFERFVNGKKIRELAAEEGVSSGSMYQFLRRHRAARGIEFDGRHRNGKPATYDERGVESA